MKKSNNETQIKQREVRVTSYFSRPTDLAGAMRSWPEFIVGDGYSVQLRSDFGLTHVDLHGEPDYVSVIGPATDPLFERVLGTVIYELSAHSDNLLVTRVT